MIDYFVRLILEFFLKTAAKVVLLFDSTKSNYFAHRRNPSFYRRTEIINHH